MTRDGRDLRIGRRWLPWRPRPRRFEAGDGLFDVAFDDLGGIALSIILSLVLVLLAPVILLVVVLTGETLLVLALVPLAALLRVLLRRPWLVEVREHGRLLHAERVVGWRASARRIRTLAERPSYLPTDPGHSTAGPALGGVPKRRLGGF